MASFASSVVVGPYVGHGVGDVGVGVVGDVLISDSSWGQSSCNGPSS